ncbi:MAG: hypothetical protein B7Z55_10140 [Planctomycetales bacterium 12-60-4]|nr:MAG: hypothetical protein B7Z55_10140 [Planctomycetales bacterium 12-60-4]
MATVNRKPEPLFLAPSRANCPVCGKPSYSSAGIHPQCAMLAADQVHLTRLKARQPTVVHPVVSSLKRHEKRCPRCETILHVRKHKCDCGYAFPTSARRECDLDG